MEETKKQKVTRFDIYKNESQIQTRLGEIYNNTMCHRMKEKDTFKTIFPTSDLFKNEYIYKTMNEVVKAAEPMDPYYDDRHHLKTNSDKKFNEEMARWKNMIKNKKEEENKSAKK